MVTSPAARPEDSDTCSSHSSQFELANPIIAEDTALEDQVMEESKDEPAQETDKRVCADHCKPDDYSFRLLIHFLMITHFAFSFS